MAEASEAQGPERVVSSEPNEGAAAAGSAADVSGVAPSASADAPSSGPEDGDATAQRNGAEPESAGAQTQSGEAQTQSGEGQTQSTEAQTQSGGTDAEPAEAASDEAGDDASAAGKRKRRRRKRRKGETESGENEAPAVGEHTEARARRRDAPAPFLRFFTGAHGGRKHGFSVGEVVAGRVKEIANGSIAVDLFGKAIAYVDEHEPREVPPAPELLREPLIEAPPVAATAAATTADVAAPEAEPASDVTSTESAEPAQVASLDGAEHEPEASSASSSEAVGQPSSAEPVEATEAVEAAETEASEVDLDADVDADGAGETTLAGDAAHAAHGPLPPAPIVPDDYPRPELPSLGQVFRGRVGAVSESGHIALVNRDFDRALVMANMQRYRDERRRVQGLVFGFNRGGFDVLVESVRAFCPASAMTLEELDDPTTLLGHKLEFLLPVSQSVTKDIIVSRRSILERLLRKKAKELLRSLEPGQRLKGRVTSVREFGLFVDIGGFEGLVHQSELSYAHGAKPSDVAAVGDEVDVQVLGVGGEPRKGPEGGGRKDRLERVSLSIKALLPDPWDAHADALKEGSARAAKVTRTTDFGAFVELAPQVEGLLHISELGRDLQHANQAVKEGEEIFVVVERVDKRARRITLSRLTAQEMEEYKASEAAGEEPPRSVRPGSRIKVKVTKAESRGLLVRVSGVLGKRARGYVPSSELVGERGDLRKAYPVGKELEVKIVSLDRDGGLRCSMKALEVDDERRAVKDYRREAAKQGFGTFGDLLRAKLGQSDSK